MERNHLPLSSLGLSLLLLLLGLAAWAAWAAAGPGLAPTPTPITPTPVPPTPTIPPTPTGLPPADPRFGVLLAAEGYIPASEILNHATINLSVAEDCWMCPVEVLDRIGLLRENRGTMAVFELNPINDLQFLDDNWGSYWPDPETGDATRLAPWAPQECSGADCIPRFTPGYILVRYAAWHPDEGEYNYFAHPPVSDCSQTPPPGRTFYRDPDFPNYISPPMQPTPPATFTPTPTGAPTATPGPPTPTPTPVPYTEWKYWICAGDEEGKWDFEMYEDGQFAAWVQLNPGMRYTIGNEEEYYMLPEAYAAWVKLIYTTVYSDAGDELATFYSAGLGVWGKAFGPGPVFLPLVVKGWPGSGSGGPPPPTPLSGYPPPTSAPTPTATQDPYPPPETLVGGPPVPPAPAPNPLATATPAPTPTRDWEAEADASRSNWLFIALDDYRQEYCPQGYCVDQDGLPAPDADRVPLDGLMAHVYTLGAVNVNCNQAANSYTEWANRLERLSWYYDRLRLRVVHTDFYMKETGIHEGSFISPHAEGSPWLMTTQSCNPNVSPDLYEACLANVDLSNRISWYILQRMEATPLPEAQVTGASWLSPYRYAWDPGVTPTPEGIPSIAWMPLGRGLVCDGLLPNCPVNEPELDWAVSPNAYGYFLGVHGVKTAACAAAGFTPVELLTSTVEGEPLPSLEQLSLRGYGPVYWQPSDQTPPSSTVDLLPPFQNTAAFTVSWSGSDAGCGIAFYDVQVRDDGGDWAGWLTRTTALSVPFSGGQDGHTYDFRVRARDHLGNQEDWPEMPDDSTTVDLTPPTSEVSGLPAYSPNPCSVSWSGYDATSGVAGYDVQVCTGSCTSPEAEWNDWMMGITETSALFSGDPGHTYHFCSRGVDHVGNEEDCPPACIEGDQCGWPIESDAQTGVAPWSRVNDLPPYTGQKTFQVCWSGIDEQSYDVYVRDGLYGGWSKWKKDTYLTCGFYKGAYGHIYYFYSVGKNQEEAEVAPYDYDTYTKVESPMAGGGPSAPPEMIETVPPDEAPDRMEEVTRTHAIGVPLLGYIAPEKDVDWYRFELTETRRLRVTLYNLPADYDLYVFDEAGEFLWASTWAYERFEEVVVRVPAGIYYVRLDGYAGAWSQGGFYH